MSRLAHKLTSSRSSFLDKVEARVKLSLYSIMHEILQSQFNSIYLFNALLLIEAGQFLWYAVHPNYSFLWTTSLSQYPRDLLKYLQVEYLFRQGNQSVFYAALYIGFALQIVMLLSLILVMARLESHKKKSSTIAYYLLRVLGIYSLLILTIGPIPLYNIFIEAVSCRDDDSLRGDVACYTGVHLINAILAVIGMVILSFFCLFTEILCIDLNPSSIIPFARPQASVGLLKLIAKIGMPVYIALDYELEHGKAFLVVFSVAWFVILFFRYHSQGYYMKIVSIVATVSEALVFWGGLTAVLQAYVYTSSTDDVGLYYFLFLSPFVTFTYYIIFAQQKWQLIKANPKKFMKAYMIERYIIMASRLVEDKGHAEERIQLEGLLRYHIQTCKKTPEQCLCSTLSVNLSKDEESVEDKMMWFRFLKSIFQDGLEMFPKNPGLHLSYAYFQQEKLNNRFKALYELIITEDHRPNLQEEFSIYRHRSIIERELIEIDIRNTDSRGIDVNSIVHFQEKFVSVQGEIGKAVNMQLDFWRELEQTTPNVQKLLFLGSKITIQADVVKTAYKKLLEINGNNIKMLQMYGNFLKDIMNDNFEAQRVIEKAEYAERSVGLDKQFGDNDRLKYSENSKTCIITCSGNLHSLGKILNANTETLGLLGYPHTELIGTNIREIIPDCIAEIHDDLMKKYFESSVPTVMGRERAIFPMSKTGFVVPCALMIKVYPNLEEGIRVVGFLRRIESSFTNKARPDYNAVQLNSKSHYIVYGGDNDVIVGISESCYDSFGVPVSLLQEKNMEFTMDSLFPTLADCNDEELKSGAGVVINIDTTNLSQNFLLRRNDTEVSHEEDEESLLKRYRVAQVRAHIVEDSIFLDKVHVKILKFNEVNDESGKNVKTNMEYDMQNMKGSKKDEGTGSQEHDTDDVEATRSEASNVSMSSAMGDDIRQLKDMKAKISEKNTPSSIASLQLISFVLTGILIALTAIQLNRKGTVDDNLEAGLTASRNSYKKITDLSDINYYARTLDLLSQGWLTSTSSPTEAATHTAISESIDSLVSVQFEVVQNRVLMNETLDDMVLDSITIRSLLEDGTVLKQKMSENDAAYNYILDAERLNAIALTDYTSGTDVTTAQMLFYYIQMNGLNSLREIGEDISASTISYYNDRADGFALFLLITMILGIAFLVLTSFLIIPKIFNVNRTNMKVLSLFGYIPPEEVEELADRCEQYIQVYLDEIAARRNYSYIGSQEDIDDDDDVEHELTQQADNAGNHKEFKRRPSNAEGGSQSHSQDLSHSQDDSAQVNYTLGMKEFPDKDENSHLKGLKSPKSQLSVPDGGESMFHSSNKSLIKGNRPLIDRSPGEKREKKEGEKEEEDEEYQEFLHERSKKLRNSNHHNKRGLILQITCFIAIFVAYFIGDFFHEKTLVKTYKDGLTHLSIIAERIYKLKFIGVYVIEELAEDDLSVVYPDLSNPATSNTRLTYEDNILSIQSAIKNSFDISFPGAFNDYFSLLLAYTNDNICSLYYSSDSTKFTQCETYGSGILKLGLIQTEVGLNQDADSVLESFYATTGRTTTTQKTYLNMDQVLEIRQITQLTTPVLESIVDEFLSAFSDYFTSFYLIQRIKFAVFFVVLILLILVVWLPYLTRLTSQIFRTKGLLNMIPMSMLKKNKALKETFISNEVLQALK